MRSLLIVLFLINVLWCQSQALQDINYYYQYNPNPDFNFDIKTVRKGNQWKIFYALQPVDSSIHREDFTIVWEKRNDLKEKQGTTVEGDSLSLTGTLTLPVSNSAVVAAKVINKKLKQAWYYYTVLENDYPVDGYLIDENKEPQLQTFFNTSDKLFIEGHRSSSMISRYQVDFPPGVPPFSEGMAPVSSTIRIDSLFRINQDDQIPIARSGMYLVQQDTSRMEGFAFNVYDDYPKYRQLVNLIDPLIYITTKQEHDRMKEANGEKKAFDKVVLSIVKDADRAKILMRSYFRRVDFSNRYFNSYKEGWKTDRGMIYIVFGPPDEVYKFMNREVWNYKGQFKVSFDFVRSPTIFDPDNYVLVRNKKYRDTWYQVIDLWRNARF